MTDQTTALGAKNVEAIYPLAPLQEGILFHCLMAPDAGTYMPQVAYHLRGAIEPERLRAAWARVQARHTALRTAIRWEERDEPFQVVYRDLPLVWDAADWSGLDPQAQAEALARLFAENRARPFDLRRPPLLRLSWRRLGPERGVLALCHHHIVLDGWSTARLLQEVMACYQAGDAAPDLPPARPYADYVRWLRRQDRTGSLAFWRDRLAGNPGPSLVFGAARGPSDFARREWPFPPGLAAAATAFASARGVTLNTLLQGALGLWTAEALGREDVFFGSATGGRPATLPGANAMVGLFINALPVRVRVDPAQPAGDWLRALQQGQAATIEHEYVALRDIQGAQGALFDCLLVVENYPVTVGGGESGVALDRVEFDEWTHFPLTLLVAPNQGDMRLILRHDRAVLPEARLEAFLDRYTTILGDLVADPGRPVGALIGPVAPAAAAPVPARLEGGAARPARSETERRLSALWAELLRIDPPGAGENFFALGGHSLLVARMATRLRRDLGLDLSVRALFERPVLGELADYLDALQAAASPVEGEVEMEF